MLEVSEGISGLGPTSLACCTGSAIRWHQNKRSALRLISTPSEKKLKPIKNGWTSRRDKVWIIASTAPRWIPDEESHMSNPARRHVELGEEAVNILRQGTQGRRNRGNLCSTCVTPRNYPHFLLRLLAWAPLQTCYLMETSAGQHCAHRVLIKSRKCCSAPLCCHFMSLLSCSSFGMLFSLCTSGHSVHVPTRAADPAGDFSWLKSQINLWTAP